MTSFVAIDFETANEKRVSACSIGLAKFDETGSCVDTFYTLIHPHPDFDYFNPVNISIHGISPEDVYSAPQWSEISGAVREFIGDLPLVAHYMGFDGYVLNDLIKLYGEEEIPNRRYCTVRLSRKILCDELPQRTLDAVYCYYFPGEMFNHHHASDDAAACGRIFARMLDEYGLEEVNQLCAPVRYRNRSKTAAPGILANQLSAEELINQYEESTILAGQRVAITGTLKHGQRADVQKMVEALGGIPEKSLTRKTTMLVVGIPNPKSWKEGSSASRKLQKAVSLREEGYPVEIFSEDEFFHRLLDSIDEASAE